MYTLGLNAYHGDSSACLYRGTELIAATEEERIRRVKHWAGLPLEAVRFCLEEAGIGLEEVDHITVSRNPLAKISRKVWHVLRKGTAFQNVQDRVKNSFSIRQLKEDLAEAFGLEERAVKAKVHYIEHHRSHMASAFFVSPFEEAALLSLDGMGDFTSTMRGIGKGNRIQVMDSVSYPHSIGIFYTAFTQYLGFPHYGDEYKLMGLAPYGEAGMVDALEEIFIFKPNGLFALNPLWFRHFKEGVAMSWDGGAPHVKPLFSRRMIEAFGPARKKEEPLTRFHKDLAASVQALTEKVIFTIAEDLHRKTRLKNLCLAGGVAQNSVANGKLLQNTSFERLFVPPAGHDAGTSTGSALYFLHQKKYFPRPAFEHQAYTGAHFSNEEITSFLREKNVQYSVYPDLELLDIVTDALTEGKVVGWFQGKAEFGPRALGNRSILVDPAREDARELLNEKIKKRESFRPFAPSVLEERVGEYFEQMASVPFMEKVFVIKKEKRAFIPAVTHVDGTGRLQTVSEKDNPRYYQLIRTFYEKTGIPILLNTSFNENEPIVNSPEHALDCFLRTDMDVLVMENILLRR